MHKTNLISLNHWKKGQDDQGLKEYLNVLSFHALLQEAETVAKDLEAQPYNSELTKKSKQILKEFNSRLTADNDGFSHSLRELRKSVEQKVSNLNGSETL